MADMMYRLVLRAQFENQAELTRAIDGLNQIQIHGAKVNIQMGGMGRASGESLNSLASSALRCGFMFNMMESALMRQEMAAMMAENAQNRLNDAVARYGANSEQARRAAKQYEAEMSYLNNANIRANVSMGLMALQLLLQSNLLNKVTLAQIANTVAKGTATIAEWAHVAALKARAIIENILAPERLPLTIAAAATAVAVIGGATMVYGQQANINVNTHVNVDTSVEDALRQQNEQVKRELKSMRP